MKPTLSITIDDELNAAVRAEVARQRRPLSWVVCEALRAGLGKHAPDSADAPSRATSARRGRTP
ncbi:ribbon-helix-helix protein, CopG family [Methylibium sp.]|uniref:ribbon-helix-helix protein, CopG family n=1 Tax=Methylibium sp. TaxID=2067992 RepID=UPI001828A77E|nr:ribbon-helix-helix protein, CopG family [Methylibium sp.]MBA3588508.1 ribbon-helix-helix protein, CopG family [Methylibium sp.]